MQKTVREDTANPQVVKQVDYLDRFQYAGAVLQFFPHAEGYVNVTPNAVSVGSPTVTYAYSYVFNYTDHLGNVRLSYSKDLTSGQLKVLEENHYYPFGLKHSIYNSGKKDFEMQDSSDTGELIPPVITNVTKTRYDYKYNGKEFQDELGLGWYDYQARNYDPALGRWMNIDPLAEMSRKFSPYAYALDNPVFFIDPDGMMAEPPPDFNGDSWTDDTGTYTKTGD